MLNGTSFFPYCPSKSLLTVVHRHNTIACLCPSSSSTGSEASLMTPHQFRFSCYVSPLSYMIPCTTHSSTTLLIPAVVSGSTCRRLFLAVPRPVFHHNAACTFRSPIIPQCTTPPPLPHCLSLLRPPARCGGVCHFTTLHRCIIYCQITNLESVSSSRFLFSLCDRVRAQSEDEVIDVKSYSL